MLIKMRDIYYNMMIQYPYRIIFILILGLISSTLFFNIEAIYSGDLSMYIHLAQAIIDGAVLYQDAIDTKNMGFILFFTGFYFIYQALFLTFWYFLLAIMFYKIVLIISNKFYAIFSAILVILTFTTIPQTFFINQPQMAIFFYLLYIYSVLKTWHLHKLINYILYGALLGICVSFSSPYIFLTLSIPILAYIEYKKDKNFLAILYRGSFAFLGFILVLLPFFIYFYKNNALADWWYWNFTFATGSYSTALCNIKNGIAL